MVYFLIRNRCSKIVFLSFICFIIIWIAWITSNYAVLACVAWCRFNCSTQLYFFATKSTGNDSIILFLLFLIHQRICSQWVCGLFIFFWIFLLRRRNVSLASFFLKRIFHQIFLRRRRTSWILNCALWFIRFLFTIEKSVIILGRRFEALECTMSHILLR